MYMPIKRQIHAPNFRKPFIELTVLMLSNVQSSGTRDHLT